MRKKPNLIPRMERCSDILVVQPEALRGKWLEGREGLTGLRIELGCGKGRFTVGTAQNEADKLLVAVEKVADAMVISMERAKAAEMKNILFIREDVKNLPLYFSPGEVERIYLNFSDPWPSRRHEDRRLTAPCFLTLYKQVLQPGGQIHFKTDNRGLFDFSLASFEKNGFSLSEVTYDLHGGGCVGVMTDYEEKFYAQGMKINRCVATYDKKAE